MSEHDRVPATPDQDTRRREMHLAPHRGAGERQGSSRDFREYDLLLRESPPRAIAITQQALAILVRLIGLAVLVIGLVVAVIILREAWGLYQEPARIERFAVAIERGSNLDQIFSFASRDTGELATGAEEGAEAPIAAAPQTPPEGGGARHLRLSYFAAWFVVLLLLFVTSVIALSAVSAGGRLVLYDTDVRSLTRAVVREVRRGRAERAGE